LHSLLRRITLREDFVLAICYPWHKNGTENLQTRESRAPRDPAKLACTEFRPYRRVTEKVQGVSV